MRALHATTVSGIDQLPEPSKSALAFLDAWAESRHGKLVPRKRDFDPLRLPALLPHIWLSRYHEAEDLFRVRLSGEKVNEAWGYSIAGKTSLEIMGPADNAVMMRIWHGVLDVPQIHYGTQERLSGNVLYAAERIAAPLAEDDGRRVYILGFSLYALGGTPDYAPPNLIENAYNIPCREL